MPTTELKVSPGGGAVSTAPDQLELYSTLLELSVWTVRVPDERSIGAPCRVVRDAMRRPKPDPRGTATIEVAQMAVLRRIENFMIAWLSSLGDTVEIIATESSPGRRAASRTSVGKEYYFIDQCVRRTRTAEYRTGFKMRGNGRIYRHVPLSCNWTKCPEGKVDRAYSKVAGIDGSKHGSRASSIHLD